MTSTSITGTTLLNCTDSDSTPSSLLPSNIFSVEGLVVVVTGGGTGTSITSRLRDVPANC